MTSTVPHRRPPVNHVRATQARAGRSVDPQLALITITTGAVLCVLWPVTLMVPQLRAAAPGSALAILVALLAHVCGLAAGYGIVVLIALMSRAPALERGVGADRLARWHSRTGRAVVLLVLVHAWAAVQSWATSRNENAALALWHVLRLPWLISATISTVLLLAVAALSVRAARRRVRWETWHTVHLLVYVGVALGFVHQLAGPDLTGHRVVQVLWAMLYLQAFALVIKHRVITPLRNATRHRMRVVQVVPEGPDVVSLLIEGRHLDELRAESGQFFRWRFLTPDTWWTAHPFSLSAAPTDTRLRLTVKVLGDGSGRLQHVEAGTWVMAEGPYGAITTQRRTCRDVLLIAGGVGITPMRALFETMPVGPGQDIVLLYRVRRGTDPLFRRELDDISRRRGVRVNYIDGDTVGPFTPDLLRWYAPNLVDRDVFLCASPGMADAVRLALRGAGLPPARLHEERFDF